MLYELHCDCGNEITVNKPIQEGPGENYCEKCGEKLYQDFRKVGIRIPEHMQAGTDAISPTLMQNQFNRSRPSGKRRTGYSLGGIKG